MPLPYSPPPLHHFGPCAVPTPIPCSPTAPPVPAPLCPPSSPTPLSPIAAPLFQPCAINLSPPPLHPSPTSLPSPSPQPHVGHRYKKTPLFTKSRCQPHIPRAPGAPVALQGRESCEWGHPHTPRPPHDPTSPPLLTSACSPGVTHGLLSFIRQLLQKQRADVNGGVGGIGGSGVGGGLGIILCWREDEGGGVEGKSCSYLQHPCPGLAVLCGAIGGS